MERHDWADYGLHIDMIQDLNPAINLQLSASRKLLRNILTKNARLGVL